MSDTVGMSGLLPGDVFLYRGTSFISQAIQFFDGSEVSHAALYLGGGRVGEAIAQGLERTDIHDSVHGAEWVKAYRLKDQPADMSPVLDKADEYLDDGPRYGYERLLLLAFLCLTRKLKVTPTLHLLIRRVLDAAAETLTRYLSQNQEPMICSEFVYRAYDEALPEKDDPYSLRINELVRSVLMGMTGTVSRGGVPLSVPRGQGVHPESLLAFLSSESSRAWLGQAMGPSERAVAPREILSEAEIGELAALYMSEAKAEPGLQIRGSIPKGGSAEELLASAEGFASALYGAQHGQPAQEAAERGMPLGKSPFIAYLFHTAADFVTPADLYRTQSLFGLGTLAL